MIYYLVGRVSMRDVIFTTPDLRPMSGNLYPDGGKGDGEEDIEKTH